MQRLITQRIHASRLEQHHLSRCARLHVREDELKSELRMNAQIEQNIRDYAAMKIQSRYRGILGRRRADHIHLRYTSAIVLQKHTRAKAGRYKVERMRQEARRVIPSERGMSMLLLRSTLSHAIKDWREFIDPQTSEYFYVNAVNGDSQWDPPPCFQTSLKCTWMCGSSDAQNHDRVCDQNFDSTKSLHAHQREVHRWHCQICLMDNSALVFPTCVMCGTNDEEVDKINGQPSSQRQKKSTRGALVFPVLAPDPFVQKDETSAFEYTQVMDVDIDKDMNNRHEVEEEEGIQEEEPILSLKDSESKSSIPWIQAFHQTFNQLPTIPQARVRYPSGSIISGSWRRKPSSSHFLGPSPHFYTHGVASVEYANGDTYVGEWHHGRREGLGRTSSYSGSSKVYSGEWKAGTREGVGTLEYPNGERYVGEFHCGKLEGKGSYQCANGDIYVGEFAENQFHGLGTFTKINGDVFEGRVDMGLAHGPGIMTYASGEVYKGMFHRDVRQGLGSLLLPNGCSYRGEFYHGRMYGHGTLCLPSGARYVGQFRNNVRHGTGVWIFPNRDRYEGQFRKNVPQGKGIYTFFETQTIYRGEFVNGRRHGFGVCTWKNQTSTLVSLNIYLNIF